MKKRLFTFRMLCIGLILIAGTSITYVLNASDARVKPRIIVTTDGEVEAALQLTVISMAPSGNRTTWVETPVTTVNLSTGTKRIRLQATTSGGLANIDYITITGNGLSAISCAGLKSTEELSDNTSDLNINLYPVPTNEILNIEFSKQPGEALTIHLFDITGKIVRSVQTSDKSYSIDMSGLPKGIYQARISGTYLNKVMRINKL